MKKTILALSTILFASQASSGPLTAADYINLVRQSNLQLKAASDQASGYGQLAREADLIVSPEFFAESKIGYDKKQNFLSGFTYDRMNSKNYAFGISQQFAMGLNAKITYNLSDVDVVNPSITIPTGNKNTDTSAQLDLTMPLWGNGFGRSTEALIQLTKKQNEMAKNAALAQKVNIETTAELNYWRVVVATEKVKINESALKLAKNIQAYVTAKKNKDLGEKSDVLQADAQVAAYTMKLEQAKEELNSASRDFNLLLNQNYDQQIPQLSSLDFNAIKEIEIPTQKPGDRFDIKASEAELNVAKANSVIAKERNKPKLDLLASYASYGGSSTAYESNKKLGKFDQDGAFVGLKFVMPLNISAQDQAIRGAEQNVSAAENNLKYLAYSQQQQWSDLVQKFAAAKKQLRLATAFDQIQSEKLENERLRLKQGRTTTYQVLMFQQDYNEAQGIKVDAASTILNVQTQVKLYQASLEGGK